MGKLYSQARRGITWLGREEKPPTSKLRQLLRMTDSSAIQRAFDFVNLIYGRDNQTTYYMNPDGWVSFSREIARKHQATGSKFIAKNDPRWNLLLHIYNRSYWTRLWIVQEFVLAKDVLIQCDRFCFDWDALTHANINFGKDYDSVPALRLFNQRNLRLKQRNFRLLQQNPQESLFSLFDAHHKAACLDNRDKFYGLLGISSFCCQKAIDVNYSISSSELCQIILDHYTHCSYSPRLHLIGRFVRTAYPLLHNGLDEINWEQPFPDMSLYCRFRGVIQGFKVMEEDAEHDSQNSVTVSIPNETDQNNSLLLWPHDTNGPIECPWRRKLGAREVSTQSIKIETSMGFWATSEGNVRNGDLVYQLNTNQAMIVRKEQNGLQFIGRATNMTGLVQFWDSQGWPVVSPHREVLINYRALCGFHLSFSEEEVGHLFTRWNCRDFSAVGGEAP